MIINMTTKSTLLESEASSFNNKKFILIDSLNKKVRDIENEIRRIDCDESIAKLCNDQILALEMIEQLQLI